MTLSASDPFPIEEVARGAGFVLAEPSRDAIATWLSTLATWNARMDLTAAKTNEEGAELMLADALVLAKHVPERARVVDVGTGAGAPGLALALARPDLSVTLVEPLAKRVSFLRTVIGTVSRTDVAIVSGKGEPLADASPGAFDVAISRATLDPSAWLALGRRLARAGGSVWALVTSESAIEERAREVVEYELPLSKKRRVMLRYENG